MLNTADDDGLRLPNSGVERRALTQSPEEFPGFPTVLVALPEGIGSSQVKLLGFTCSIPSEGGCP